jgi:CRISPR-associated protein Cas1
MKRSLYINSHCTLQRDQNTLLLELEDGTKRYLPIEGVRELHIFGEVDLNKRVLEFLSQNQVLVHFYNYYGYYTGTYYPREHFNSGYMILKQVEHYLDESRRLELARRFVRGALVNLMHIARYYHQRGVELGEALQTLQTHHDALGACDTIENLMQLEGKAREAYYALFDRVLEHPDFAFEKRTRRPPRNRLNALCRSATACSTPPPCPKSTRRISTRALATCTRPTSDASRSTSTSPKCSSPCWSIALS